MSSLIQEIGGLSVPELASEFGTPLYVYDAVTMRKRIQQLAAFDVIRYAQKACSNIAVLDLMRKEGVVVDAVSAGEIHRAQAAGYETGFAEPPQIVYTADIFDHDSLNKVIELDIPVNCGSPDMISQYGERAPGKPITLRINPGFGHGHSQKTNTGGEQSKHGIWHAELEDCIARAAEHQLSIAGLHMHIGSGTDIEHLSQVSAAMEKAAMTVGSSITSISAGGGLPTPYRQDDEEVDLSAYFELWDAARGRLAKEFGHHVSLEIEPGRFLTAESGWLVAEVRAVKQMGDNQFYLLDAGFNNLARPIMYGSYHPMFVCPADGDTSREERSVVVGGPLCESGDIFTQEEGGYVSHRMLPTAKTGDLVVIGCAGAYGYAMSSNYNSKPLCAEVLIDGGKAHLVRESQSVEDLIRHERIPAS